MSVTYADRKGYVPTVDGSAVKNTAALQARSEKKRQMQVELAYEGFCLL